MGTRPRKGLDHGQHALRLGIGIDRGKAGACGLATDIDDVGTVVEHLEPVRNRGIGVEVLAAIAKRIGVTFRTPMMRRAIELELVLAAAQTLESRAMRILSRTFESLYCIQRGQARHTRARFPISSSIVTRMKPYIALQM